MARTFGNVLAHPVRAGLASMELSWGYRREQERSPDWQSNEQPFGHGAVQVERSLSKSCLMGFRGEQRLHEWRVSGANTLTSD